MSAPYLVTDRVTLYHAAAEAVYPRLNPGSVAMVWSDGPYGLSKAPWDRMSIDGLAEWYAPHVEAWGTACAPAATIYLWNTAAGWARLDPVMRAGGWTFRVLITWLKTNPPSQRGVAALTCWADFTEVCGVYQRATVGARSPGQHVAYAAGASDGNTIRLWLNQERTRAGLSGDALRRAIDEAGGKGNMLCRHSFSRSQWVLPTWFQWQALHRAWNARGNPEGRPYLQRDRSRTYDLSLAGDVADLRSEYDTLRCPFTAPPDGASNVWTAPTVPPTARLKDEDGHPHPCQKPLAFAERAVHASTRAGDVVLDPFAGTNRIAIACSRLPAPEARHAVGIEMDRRWLDAVRPLLHCAPGAAKPRQASLFGRAP